jgi:hypothetical protein
VWTYLGIEDRKDFVVSVKSHFRGGNSTWISNHTNLFSEHTLTTTE